MGCGDGDEPHCAGGDGYIASEVRGCSLLPVASYVVYAYARGCDGQIYVFYVPLCFSLSLD